MRTKRYSIVTGLVLILTLLVSSLLNPGSANAATDKVKPTISGATNSVAYLNHSFDPRKGVTAKDNVDGNITSIIKISGKVNTKKLGKYTLTYKVTDSAKNTCTIKRVITVQKDTTKPKITGASNKTIYMGYSFNPKVDVKATDNAAGNLTSKIKVNGKVNTKKVGKYKLTYIVTDKAKNTSKVTRTITVKKDTTKPKITGASNKTIYKGYSFNTKTGVKATDNVDGNITSKIKISGKLNVNEVGIYKLKYIVEDKTKNKTTVTRTITVKKDTTKPKITGASNVTINYGSSFDPKKGVKATDNIDGTITSRMTVTGTVKTNKVGAYKVTYSVKDKTGNRTTVTRTVNVVDKVRPVLSGISNSTASFGKSFDPLSGIKAKDAVDGDLTSFIKVEGEVNVNKLGIYRLIYTIKDKSGNIATVERIVEVVDNVAPTISGADDITIQLLDTMDPMKGVTANDNYDGDLTSKITVEKKIGEIDPWCVGYYWLEYRVSDRAGNKAVYRRKVTVNYRNAIFKGLYDVTINCGENFNPREGVTAFDEATGKEITKDISINYYVNVNKPGIYYVNYYIPENKGYEGIERRRKVTVVDKILPTMTGVKDRTVSQNSSLPDLLEGVKATDNIDGDLTSEIELEHNIDTSKVGDYTVTYRVVDKSGNVRVEHCTVTVEYVPVTSIIVRYIYDDPDISGLTLKTGQTVALHPSISPWNASVRKVLWTSSDESVATINEKGVAVALKEGTVTFTAIGDGGVAGNLTFEVTNKPDLYFDEVGYGDISTEFSLINRSNEIVDMEAVKVINKDGSVEKEYSKEELEGMGLETVLLGSSKFKMHIKFTESVYSKLEKLVVIAGPRDGKKYEYTHCYEWPE